MKNRRLWLVLCVLAVLLLTAFQAGGGEVDLQEAQALFVGAVVALVTQGIKLIAMFNPGWQPPEGTFGKIQYALAVGFSVLIPLSIAMGWSGDLGIVLFETAGILNALALLVGAIVASSGLYEFFRRVFGWAGKQLAYTP